VPMTSTDSKWSTPTINKSIDMALPWYRYDQARRSWGKRCQHADKNNIATWDLGEAVHPAHFCVWRLESGAWRQIASEWFDKVPYTRASGSTELTQLDIINQSKLFFGWTKLYADNTDRVLQFIHERKEMPGLVPIKITVPVRKSFINEITKYLGTPALKLVSDERQAAQLHQIRNDGSCPVSYGPNGGHGEPLTTVGLALIGHLIEAQDVKKRTRIVPHGTRLKKTARRAASWNF